MNPIAEELLSYWGSRFSKLTTFGKEALTCAAVCKITGLSEDCIGKAMLVRVDQKMVMVLLPGDKRLDTSSLKRHLQASKVSLLPPKEITEKTQLVVGAVTPFICFKREDIVLAMDESLLSKSQINISTGDATVGVNVNPKDLQEALNPRVGSFTT